MRKPKKQLTDHKKVLIKIFLITAIVFSMNSLLRSQQINSIFNTKKKIAYSFINDKISDDTTVKVNGKNKVQKVNIGGIFIAPTIGSSFPLSTFGNYSNPGLLYGAKVELAYSRLYPLIFGFVYEIQKNKGNADFTTVNSLTKFDTKITSLGGSLDIILNKYFKSDFTTPVLSFEIKYATVVREVTPESARPDIPRNLSMLTYSGAMIFTIYVFDLSAKYTYAKDFNSLNFQLRFHFPVIKF